MQSSSVASSDAYAELEETQPRWQLGWLTSKQQHWHAAGFGMLSQHTKDLELANAWSPRTKDSESLKTSPWLWKPGFRRSTLRMISDDNYAIKGSRNRQKLEVDPLCSSLIRCSNPMSWKCVNQRQLLFIASNLGQKVYLSLLHLIQNFFCFIWFEEIRIETGCVKILLFWISTRLTNGIHACVKKL